MTINKSSDLKKGRAMTPLLTKLKQATAAPDDGLLSFALRLLHPATVFICVNCLAQYLAHGSSSKKKKKKVNCSPFQKI